MIQLAFYRGSVIFYQVMNELSRLAVTVSARIAAPTLGLQIFFVVVDVEVADFLLGVVVVPRAELLNWEPL